MAGHRLAAALRRRRHPYISILLTYWLSSTPVMAYDSIDAAGIDQAGQPQAYTQSISLENPHPRVTQYSARGILLSENSQGVLTDSPYLARRLNDGGGTGSHYRSEPRRHPANLPPVPNFRRPTPSLFPVHRTAPVAAVATPAPAPKNVVVKVKPAPEPIPAPRVITQKATEADLAQNAEKRKEKAAAEQLATELKVKAQQQPVAQPAPAPMPAVAAVRPAAAPKPRVPMPAATTIESGLALREVAHQPEIIPLPDVPLPPREALKPVTPEQQEMAVTPFSPADAPEKLVAVEPEPQPKPILAAKAPLKSEVIRAQPIISKGDRVAAKKVMPAQPKLVAKKKPVMPKAAEPVLAEPVLKTPAPAQPKLAAKKPSAKTTEHVLKAPEPKLMQAEKTTSAAASDTSAEESAKSILRMSSGGDVTDIKVSSLKAPEQTPAKNEVIMQKLPKKAAAAVKPVVAKEKNTLGTVSVARTPRPLPATVSAVGKPKGNVLIQQVPAGTTVQKTVPNSLMPKAAKGNAAAAPAQMPIRTKKEVAGEIEAKLQEALAARGKASAEPQHYTSPSLSAHNLPPEMANQTEENPAALANKPVTPKAVAKIQAAIEALRKANADHAAGIGQKHEQELKVVESEKTRAEADKKRAEAEAAKLKQELVQKERIAAAAKAEARAANAQALKMPEPMQPSPLPQKAPEILKMPSISDAGDMSQGEMALLGAAGTKDSEAAAKAAPAATPQPKQPAKASNAATFSLIDELEQSMGSEEDDLAPLPEPEPLPPVKPQSSLKGPFYSSDQEEAHRLAALAPAAGPVLPNDSPLWLSKEAQEQEAAAVLAKEEVADITPRYTSTPVIAERVTETGVEANIVETLAMPLNAEKPLEAPSAAEEALLFQAGSKPVSEEEKLVSVTELPAEIPADPNAPKPIALKPDDTLVQEAIPASPNGLLITIQPDQPLAPKETQIASIEPTVPESAVVPMKETKVERMIGGGKPITLLKPPAPLPAKEPVLPEGTKIVTAASKPVPNQGDTISHVSTPPFMVKKVMMQSSVLEPAAEPQSVPVPDSYASASSLSMETREILSKLPSGLGAPVPLPEPEKPARMENPDLVTSHEARGVSIEMRRPNFNIQTTMEDAYSALMKSDLGTAMDRYQMVLEAQPHNNDAKFGLATIYHRMGEGAMARGLYSEVLKSEPQNLEALNNLLVLVSQESPQEALGELEQLELRNPAFSPIPAQLASIHAKLGNPEEAIRNIQKAIALEPENLAYQYNLAVLLDKAGQRDEAVELYVALKRAYQRGEEIPADIHAIQERLTFLLSNRG